MISFSPGGKFVTFGGGRGTRDVDFVAFVQQLTEKTNLLLRFGFLLKNS